MKYLVKKRQRPYRNMLMDYLFSVCKKFDENMAAKTRISTKNWGFLKFGLLWWVLANFKFSSWQYREAIVAWKAADIESTNAPEPPDVVLWTLEHSAMRITRFHIVHILQCKIYGVERTCLTLATDCTWPIRKILDQTHRKFEKFFFADTSLGDTKGTNFVLRNSQKKLNNVQWTSCLKRTESSRLERSCWSYSGTMTVQVEHYPVDSIHPELSVNFIEWKQSSFR